MQPSPKGATPDERPYPVLSNRAILWSAVLLIAIAIGLAVFLLTIFGTGQHADQLNAIKTAGTIVVGTGGAAALWLTARRQRTNEIALNQKRIDQQATDRAFAFQEKLAEQNRLYQERVAAATEHDATERRLTDLYLKAVEQLGSDKAAVRQGGLYALERVAQNNHTQRQTVINVLCAYLRAPYTAPERAMAVRRIGVRRPLNKTSRSSLQGLAQPYAAISEEVRQEREVRLTVQNILTRHLQPGDLKNPEDTYWSEIDLDLTGATLIDFDLSSCHVRVARFAGATFVGRAKFREVSFAGFADFGDVRFEGNVEFSRATFAEYANFWQVVSISNIEFNRATFMGIATFADAKFLGYALFAEVRFRDRVSYVRTGFGGYVEFTDANFEGSVAFKRATFAAMTLFEKSRFARGAEFQHSEFLASVEFRKATFLSGVEFQGARFSDVAEFDGATFGVAPGLRNVHFIEGMPNGLDGYISVGPTLTRN